MKFVCAWCPGFVPGTETEPTSHGICAECLARVSRLTDSAPPEPEPAAEAEPEDEPHIAGPPIDFHE